MDREGPICCDGAVNLYACAENDPVNWQDWTGRAATCSEAAEPSFRLGVTEVPERDEPRRDPRRPEDLHACE